MAVTDRQSLDSLANSSTDRQFGEITGTLVDGKTSEITGTLSTMDGDGGGGGLGG